MSDFSRERLGMGEWPNVPPADERPWRVGRKVGRTIYAMRDPAGLVATEGDDLIGMMDTRELAMRVVAAHNHRLTQDREFRSRR
jgi:hypothetical protein